MDSGVSGGYNRCMSDNIESTACRSRRAGTVSVAAAAVLAAALATTGCSRFDPGAAYTLIGADEVEPTPVPDGTPIIEHEPLPIDARTERIRLVEELFTSGGDEPFYRPGSLDVDAQGNLFVFDHGLHYIASFDRFGSFVRAIGRLGQGPGEIGEGGRIAIAGDWLVHVSRNRVNTWVATGEVVASRNITFTRFLLPIEGTDDGGVVGLARRGRGDDAREVVVRMDIEGNHEIDYAVLPRVRSLSVVQGSRGSNTGISRPQPTFAVARTGEVYVTTGSEYLVLALARDGQPRWGLRVPWPRSPLTDERIDRGLARVMGLDDEDDDIPSTIRNVERSRANWPEYLPALVGSFSGRGPRTEPLRVDGHGHLYVFPYIPDDWDRSDQPVDVYSNDGDRLFSGLIPIVPWGAARGDFIYGVSTDPETEEYRVVRYRLVEPFHE